MTPEIRYADSGGINIAYSVLGEGPLDLLFVGGALTNRAVLWEEPNYRPSASA